MMIRITDAIALDESEITEHFIRSPGPGGQNVYNALNPDSPDGLPI